jgi:hypothetical protein
MGRISYHGGSTVIGWGSYWARRYALGTPDGAVAEKKRSKRAARRARAKARKGNPAPAPPRKPRMKFPKSSLTQKEVLAGLGLLPLPPKPHARGPILKNLVAEGVLLPNGQPNPHNEKVRAIAARTGKTQ